MAAVALRHAVLSVQFVENKHPDLAAVAALLEECADVNQWANFGPLYHRLADEYARHMRLSEDMALIPCASAGLGLELLAREQAAAEGVAKLRWVGPSLSFKNLGRGYFAEMELLDCDSSGLLDIKALRQLPLDHYDGIVVINPFGMCTDFTDLMRFARTAGKKLVIDNAAGLDRNIPDWPFQVFSLHQTKPYGVGEGGLIVLPRARYDRLLDLMNYADVPENPAHWLNNAKISDIACAFQLARLRSIELWENAYRDQRHRITGLFASAGICPLYDPAPAPLTTSLPVLLPATIDTQKLAEPRQIPISRQYRPLECRPQADLLYARLINFPCHPDMALLDDGLIMAEISQIVACCEKAAP